MSSQLIIVIIYIFILLSLAGVSLFVVRRVDKQADALINIASSFSNISKDLKIISKRLEDYDKHNERQNDAHKELITIALKNVSDRMEKLEKSSGNHLTKMDNDVCKLFMYCSRKIERDSGNNI